MTQDIKELVLNEYKNGNIVVAGIEGLQTMPIKDFIKQDAEFMLYDLNRSEAVVLTFIDDPKWVNDYAVGKVIRELKQQLSAEREAHKKEIERILSAVARGEKLANSLNFDGKSELDKERERAGKLVSALRSISAYTEDNFIQQKANQTLNDYDTATKEPGSH